MTFEIYDEPPPAAGRFEISDTGPNNETSTTSDMAASALSAPLRAATAVVGMPRTASDIRDAATRGISGSSMPSWLKVAAAAGINANPALNIAMMMGKLLPTTQQIRDLIAKVPLLDIVNYDPQSTAGRYTQAAVEGATTGIPFGPMGMASGVTAGLGGEAGGDLARTQLGPQAEPYGRALGAIAGGGVPAISKLAFGNRAADLIASAASGTQPSEFQAAMDAQRRANAIGAPVTGPEALNNPQLLQLQRAAETNPSSAGALRQWMAQRGKLTTGAINSELDQVGPQVANPALTAADVNVAAEKSLDQIRQSGNAVARPLYQQAESALVPTGKPASTILGPNGQPATSATTGEFEKLTSDPVVSKAIDAVMNDPFYGVVGEKSNSVKVLDAAKKYLDDVAQSASRTGENNKARIASQSIARVLDAADHTAPSYASARGIVEKNMASNYRPVEVGPVGKLQKAGTTSQQFDALTNPLQDVTPTLAGDAARRLKMNNPTAFRDLVRNGMEQQLDAALSARGDATRVGERFLKNVGETPQATANVRALLGELPDGQIRVKAFDNLIETMKVQARRLPGNSATAEKTATLDFMKPNGILKLVRQPLESATNAWARLFQGETNKDLARFFTDPNSVAEIRRLALTNPRNAKAASLVPGVLAGTRAPEETR